MKVTTAMGKHIQINPAHIRFIIGMPMRDSGPMIRLVGVRKKPVRLKRRGEMFIARLPNRTNFVRLSLARSGHPFWANVKAITGIRLPTDKELEAMPHAKSVVHFAKAKRYITNDIYSAKSLMRSAGSHL
jgi:hypothetical protein